MADNRQKLAREIVELSIQIADQAQKIEDAKTGLRAIATAAGVGFNIEVKGKGSVEVRAGSDSRLKGLMPTLDAEAFLQLPEETRAGLLKSGLVTMDEQWTQARNPSVTVRLA